MLPSPKSSRRCTGTYSLSKATPRTQATILLLPAAPTPGLLLTAETFRDRIEHHTGVRIAIAARDGSKSDGPCIRLRFGDDLTEVHEPSSIAAQRYRLLVGEAGVDIEAQSEVGLRYGLETLAQLVDRRGRIPCCEIEDEPDLPRRGIMLDISRGKVPTESTMRSLVDLCARMKLNVLMLYTEHTFQFRAHPEIGKDDSPTSAEQMLRLDAYAAHRGVELVPCLQSLGHMEHVLKLPRYRDLSETDMGWTISPVEGGTHDLLRDMYSEYLPLFGSELFNANCDEPWDLARGKSKAREAELGPGGVFLEHVEKLRQVARAHGKRTMIWADVAHGHPERIPELDRDLILLDWWYEAKCDYDRVSRFANENIEFWVCPGTSSWNCLFPRVTNSIANIRGWADSARKHGATGLLNTDWGDGGHYNLQGVSLFGYGWGAQHAWSGEAAARDFDRAFSRLVFDDATGESARLYRALGDVHDVGFLGINGSALQSLYFDTFTDAVFLAATKRGKLENARKKLEKIASRIEKLRAKNAEDSDASELGRFAAIALDELAWAADASRFSTEKAEAALESIAWRRDPSLANVRARRVLARKLAKLADTQDAQRKLLRRLWLSRSEQSNWSTTDRRIRRAIKSLRTESKSLESNRPSPPPSTEPLTPRRAIEAYRDSHRS